MNRVPVITGIGLVTPLGNNVPETWDALLAGRFIRTHERCPLDRSSADRVNTLAIAAAGEAMSDARWTGGGAALVVGTSKGAIETSLTAPPVVQFLSSTAEALRARFPLLDGGASLTISAACASGIHALIRAAMMIQSGEATRVLVLAAEASVHPLFLGSFKRLGVLPREEIGCRPFDVDRDGFLMSEAAAAVCLEARELESGEPARPRAGRDANRPEDGPALPGFPPYACVDRYVLAGDATHMTAGDPDGSTLRRILRTTIADRSVDLIHAHGTGTVFNDPIELAAFEAECVRELASPPTVYSHKGALGHSLGASGLVSVALSCRMHREQFVPPNVRTRSPIQGPIIGVMLSSTGKREIRRSVCISAGFGGAMAAVTLCS
jgi:3-oxoacyl-[acyl-carrier-protein] synthase II